MRTNLAGQSVKTRIIAEAQIKTDKVAGAPKGETTALAFPRRVDPCLDARQVLQGAIQKGLKLEPATLAALARLQ